MTEPVQTRRTTKLTCSLKGIRICHPKNMPLWHENYCTLKAIKKKPTQKELFALRHKFPFVNVFLLLSPIPREE